MGSGTNREGSVHAKGASVRVDSTSGVNTSSPVELFTLQERKIQQPCPGRWSLGVLQPPADEHGGLNVRFNFSLSLVRKGTKIDVSYSTSTTPNAKEKGKENTQIYHVLRV